MIHEAKLSDPETFAVVDDVCKKLGRHMKFAYYDADDIAQECWAWSIALLDSGLYIPSKSSLRTFLYIYLRNQIGMLRRRIYENNRECQQCGGKPNETCSACFVQYVRNKSKKGLAAPLSVNFVCPDEFAGGPDTVIDEASFNELMDTIDVNMPIHLRADYLRLIDGAKEYVSPHRKAIIRGVMKNIMEDFYGQSEDDLAQDPVD